MIGNTFLLFTAICILCFSIGWAIKKDYPQKTWTGLRAAGVKSRQKIQSHGIFFSISVIVIVIVTVVSGYRGYENIQNKLLEINGARGEWYWSDLLVTEVLIWFFVSLFFLFLLAILLYRQARQITNPDETPGETPRTPPATKRILSVTFTLLILLLFLLFLTWNWYNYPEQVAEIGAYAGDFGNRLWVLGGLFLLFFLVNTLEQRGLAKMVAVIIFFVIIVSGLQMLWNNRASVGEDIKRTLKIPQTGSAIEAIASLPKRGIHCQDERYKKPGTWSDSFVVKKGGEEFFFCLPDDKVVEFQARSGRFTFHKFGNTEPIYTDDFTQKTPGKMRVWLFSNGDPYTSSRTLFIDFKAWTPTKE